MNFLISRSRSRSRKNSVSMIMSAEKWRSGRKLSRRDNDFFIEEDQEEDVEPHFKEITDWVQEFFGRKSDTADMTDQDIEVTLTKKQTLILSTLVPDEILLLDKFNSLNPKRFVGVLMMADVSGYTALSERYHNTGKGGTYRLTVTLNTYLGSLIEVIYSHGGDIIKFAGDAFLALWKTDKRTFMCHTIHSVIACALIIQHSYASYETDVKVNLKVKLAISAGNLIFTPIGTGIDLNYIIFGLPVLEAKAAESVCASGEVKLTPTAWGHCYSRNYDYIIDDKGFVTIKSILYDPHDTHVTRPFLGFGNMIRQIKKPFVAIENLPELLFDSSKGLNASDVLKKSEALNLRKTILLAEEKNIGSEIRKFMIRSVLTQIDAHQPLEYLTEMRHVSILFLTLKPKDFSFAQLLIIVNNAYQITCEIVCKSMGCVNKIILFDKDIMMLVVFGLRGFKHESEAQAALKCAYSIKKTVSALDGVVEVSIGVTTGQVYCGVIGHPLRREFTVIGAIVNKAARLMCKFRNKITCDETTFVKSKMSSNSFTLQPSVELKGINKSGKIYEYSEEIRVKEINNIPMIAPLLDRVDEIEYFETWLEDSEPLIRDFDALLLVGESRIGKTRLLEWMARCAKNRGYNVCSINLTSIHSATAYLGLSQIINQILGLEEPIEGFIKEEKIVQLLQAYSDDLCYLNNIIKVRFAYHEGIQTLDENKRIEKAKLVFTRLIQAITEKQIIFLDDLQNLDESSWEFISMMFDSLKIFTILTVTRGKFSAMHDWLYKVLINSNIRKISLSPLESEWIPALACQILDIDGVANDLCHALRSKCRGMPGLVESVIIHLFSTGTLEIKKISNSEIDIWTEKEDLVFPDPDLLHPQALHSNDQHSLNQIIENQENEKNICIVTRKEELNSNLNVQNIDALIMIQIDSLTPYQQLLLKIASVIGNIIPRDLLENIMYENNWLITVKAVKRLFVLNILTCANSYCLTKWEHNASKSTSGPCNVNLSCQCKFEYNEEEFENIPKYALCKLMRFRNRNSRKTCYELLPINQKREFHSRIVTYLENNKQKCTDCGGKIMLVRSWESLLREPYVRGNDLKSTESVSQVKHEVSDTKVTNETEFNAALKPKGSDNITGSTTLLNSTENIIKPARATSVLLSNFKDRALYVNRNSQCQPILRTRKSDEIINTDKCKSTKKVTVQRSTSLMSLSYPTEQSDSKFFDMIRGIMEAADLSDWHNLGIIDSQDNMTRNDIIKQSFRVNIAKGVSETDFSRCTCAELNITIYEQLVYHALRADLKIKAIEFLIQYCYLCVLNNNLDNVSLKLEEAEKMCDGCLDSFDKKRFLGKLYSLRAAAYLIQGKLTAAKLAIEQALKIYNIAIVKVPGYLRIKNIAAMLSFHQRKQRIHRNILKADSIFCLNIGTLLYTTLGDERTSRITALRALNIIQTVDCSVINTCDAYSNAIQLELDRGMPENTKSIEQMAIQSLCQLTNPIEADELFALGKLFMVTFRARIARGELAAGIRSGFRSITISRFVQADDVDFEIIPDLFYILLARRRIDEAVDIIQCALHSSKNSCISHECETWYYALCLDLILDSGFKVESPQDISHFAEYAIQKGKAAGGGRRRLVVGLWTYWLRIDSETKAKRFESEALSWLLHNDDFSMTTLLSALRLTEGLLESLARKMNDLRKVVDLLELRSIADRELVRLENDARLIRAVCPRWYLLKANSCKLSGRHSMANGFYNQALEEARLIDNRLEESLARAAAANSKVWIQNARASTFNDWRTATEKTRTSWHQLMYKMSNSRK